MPQAVLQVLARAIGGLTLTQLARALKRPSGAIRQVLLLPVYEHDCSHPTGAAAGVRAARLLLPPEAATRVADLEREIDARVYELHGLGGKGIGIVEG